MIYLIDPSPGNNGKSGLFILFLLFGAAAFFIFLNAEALQAENTQLAEAVIVEETRSGAVSDENEQLKSENQRLSIQNTENQEKLAQKDRLIDAITQEKALAEMDAKQAKDQLAIVLKENDGLKAALQEEKEQNLAATKPTAQNPGSSSQASGSAYPGQQNMPGGVQPTPLPPTALQTSKDIGISGLIHSRLPDGWSIPKTISVLLTIGVFIVIAMVFGYLWHISK